MAKKNKRPPRFLEVGFRDNDFMLPVLQGLERLWYYIHEDSCSVLDCDVASVIYDLDKDKMLLPLLQFSIDVAYLDQKIEHVTRGINKRNWKKMKLMDWDVVSSRDHGSITKEYLKLDIKFHADSRFSDEWQNSEHAALDMITGKAWTF